MTAPGLEPRLERLRQWLLDRHPECPEIAPDTDLLDGVLADSLEFIAFLVFVEDVRGAPIEAEDVDPESFRTLDTIRGAFLTDPAPAQ
jgi:acyl carrier protein